MAKIFKHLTDLIGNTPLLELSSYGKSKSIGAHLIAKLEYFNPFGSVKDRIALAMIEDAEITRRAETRSRRLLSLPAVTQVLDWLLWQRQKVIP